MILVKEGQCPYCQSEDVTFDSDFVDVNGLAHQGTCNNCQRTFVAHYNLTFKGISTDNGEFLEDGTEVGEE